MSFARILTGVIAALANRNVKTAYLDGELCGVNDVGFVAPLLFNPRCDHSKRPI